MKWPWQSHGEPEPQSPDWIMSRCKDHGRFEVAVSEMALTEWCGKDVGTVFVLATCPIGCKVAHQVSVDIAWYLARHGARHAGTILDRELDEWDRRSMTGRVDA